MASRKGDEDGKFKCRFGRSTFIQGVMEVHVINLTTNRTNQNKKKIIYHFFHKFFQTELKSIYI
jgi:hypothetical protein